MLIGVLTNLFVFILSVALLIILHELGHYLAARWVKVDVEEFGLGFPPRIKSLFTWKGTMFSLNWIPLGGFVRLKGETDPSVPGGLGAASPLARIAIYFAGPLANFLVAVVVFSIILFQFGAPIPERVIVSAVGEGTPAEAAGFQPGDEILTANGERIDSSARLIEIISSHSGERVTITLLRAGQELTLYPVPQLMEDQVGRIGVNISHPTTPISVPAALAGGLGIVGFQIESIVSLPVRIISGSAAPEEGRLVGYKGMFDMFSTVRAMDQEAAASSLPGYLNTLSFIGAISVSLAVLNLLPVPALDGGRIFFTLPELFFRRRLPVEWENMVNLIGFGMLILLLLYVNLQDFLNPVVLP